MPLEKKGTRINTSLHHGKKMIAKSYVQKTPIAKLSNIFPLQNLKKGVANSKPNKCMPTEKIVIKNIVISKIN